LPIPGPAGEIKRLFVRPEYRGLGVALRLLQTLEQFARSQNTKWLYLDTKDDLKDAIAFYLRNGYTACTRYNDNPQATKFMRKQLTSPVIVRSFQTGDEDAFRRLNEAWISKHFRIEAKDRQTLEDPRTHILSPGGQIFMATVDGEPIGSCALLALGDGSFEVAKMAVAETHRGQGIGRLLLEHSIAFARTNGVGRLYLETNNSLADAIHLYESVGFRHLPADQVTPSVYARANVYMELIFAEASLR
jgi:GNAT superfamily N-acetyltransferase